MSSSNNDSNEKDATTNQVLDYYKKYSQNRDLPKYFSGSSVSYLPQIGNIDAQTQKNKPRPKNSHEEQYARGDVVVQTNIDVKITTPTVSEKSEDASRSSSAASLRRLEWDNGADIGYSNCQKQKPKTRMLSKRSSSLTALTELQNKNHDIDPEKLVSEYSKCESSSTSNVQVIIVTYSSSSSDDDNVEENKNNIEFSSASSGVEAEPEQIITSSTSTDLPIKSSTSNSDNSPKLEFRERIDKKMSNFAVTLLQLKQKIGLPNAHSTPNYFEFLPINPKKLLDTPFVKKPDKVPRKILEKSMKPSSKSDNEVSVSSEHKQFEANLFSSRSEESLYNIISQSSKSHSTKSVFSKKRSSPLLVCSVPKVVNLCLTKPITVECTCSPVVPKNQLVQTVTKLSTVSVQTDVILESELAQDLKLCGSAKGVNQSVEYLEHNEGDIRTNSSSSQTDSYVLASCCGSFEYKKIPDDNRKPIKKPGDVPLENKVVGGLKRSQREPDLREPDLREPESEFKSAQSLNQLGNRATVNSATENIERAIHLIHKLIQSKKYDATVKKKYIKTIIQKMSTSKYFEESSTSSDLFFPKKSRVDPTKGTSSDSSCQKTGKHSCLQSNLPWFPAHNKVAKFPSPKKRKLEIKTFTDMIPPNNTHNSKGRSSSPDIIPVETKSKNKNSYFTLTNNEFCVNKMTDSTNSDGPCVAAKSESQEGTCASWRKHYQSTSTSGSVSYENWREDKTLSEKLRESARPATKRDYLANFADQERQQQLTWINSEITHLSKLRSLLKQPGHKTGTKHVQQTIKKRTTVYKVHESDSDPVKSSTGSSRNYVIETELGAPTCGNMEYKLNGRKYSVDKIGEETRNLSFKPHVAGDIKVTTRDNVTNIKVSTSCQVCKQVPCVCVCPKCSRSHYDFDKPTVCDKAACTCSKDSPVGSYGKLCECKNCKREICSICLHRPCICKETKENKASFQQGFAGVGDRITCPVCLRTPCICKERKNTFQQCFPEVSDKDVNICTTCLRTPCICHMAVTESVQCLTTRVSDKNVGVCPVCCKISCICSHTKYSADQACTFPKMSDKKEGDPLPHTYPKRVCSVGEKHPYICPLPERKPSFSHTTAQTTISKTRDAQEQFESSSLKRVFENCDCTTQTNCDCPFVDKLVRHFNQNTEKPFGGDKLIQTGKCKCQNVGVQVRVQTQHGFSQTAKQDPVVLSAVHQKTDTIGGADVKCQGTQMSYEVKSVSTEEPENFHLTFGDQVQTRATQYEGHSKAVGTGVRFEPVTKNKEVQALERSDQKQTTEKCVGENIVQLQNKGVNTRSNNEVIFTQTYAGLKHLEAQTRTDNASGHTQTTCGPQKHGCSCVNIARMDKDCTCGCHPAHIVDKKTGKSSGSSTNESTVPNKKTGKSSGSSANESILQNKKTGKPWVSSTIQSTTQNKNAGKSSGSSTKGSTASPAGYKPQLKFGKTAELQVGDGKFKYDTVAASTQYSPQEQYTRTRKTGKDFGEAESVERRGRHPSLEGAGERLCTCYGCNSTARDHAVCTCDPPTSNGTYVSSSVLDSEDTSHLTCVCCKKPETLGNVQIYCYGAQMYPLCGHCHQENPGNALHDPASVCQCDDYNNIYGGTSASVHQENAQNAEDFDGEHCTCTKPYQHPQNYGYCGHCQNRLRKTARGRGGIAYSLKVEDVSPNKFRIKKKKEQTLEEIRIRVPRGRTITRKKGDKDKENYNKKVNECQECARFMSTNDGCPKCVKISKLAHEKKVQKEAQKASKKGDINAVVTEVSVEMVSDDHSEKIPKTTESTFSLQEYLRKNRPDFVDSAENRRKAVMISKLQREDDKDEMRLRFLSENAKKPPNYYGRNERLFSEREMKEITKRNYKKLPEVQAKLSNQKVQRLRNADRIIKDVLTTKIRTSVLKGKRNFPLDKNVVGLPIA